MTTGIGETLQDAREQQGRTLEDVARSLRLRTDQVRALEEERFASFGGDVYARGFLKSYALELEIDPQPLLDTYRRDVSDNARSGVALIAPGAAALGRQRSAPPAWLGWVVAAVVILVGLAALGQLAGGRAPETASPEDLPPPAPAGNEEEPAEDGEEEPPEEDEPEPEPTFDGVDLLLTLEERSWMRVSVDGTVVFEQVAEQGETLPFPGEQEVVVRYGNAGGVRVEFNGEDLGPPGARGDVVEVVYTPDGPDPSA